MRHVVLCAAVVLLGAFGALTLSAHAEPSPESIPQDAPFSPLWQETVKQMTMKMGIGRSYTMRRVIYAKNKDPEEGAGEWLCGEVRWEQDDGSRTGFKPFIAFEADRFYLLIEGEGGFAGLWKDACADRSSLNVTVIKK